MAAPLEAVRHRALPVDVGGNDEGHRELVLVRDDNALEFLRPRRKPAPNEIGSRTRTFLAEES